MNRGPKNSTIISKSDEQNKRLRGITGNSANQSNSNNNKNQVQDNTKDSKSFFSANNRIVKIHENGHDNKNYCVKSIGLDESLERIDLRQSFENKLRNNLKNTQQLISAKSLNKRKEGRENQDISLENNPNYMNKSRTMAINQFDILQKKESEERRGSAFGDRHNSENMPNKSTMDSKIRTRTISQTKKNEEEHYFQEYEEEENGNNIQNRVLDRTAEGYNHPNQSLNSWHSSLNNLNLVSRSNCFEKIVENNWPSENLNQRFKTHQIERDRLKNSQLNENDLRQDISQNNISINKKPNIFPTPPKPISATSKPSSEAVIFKINQKLDNILQKNNILDRSALFSIKESEGKKSNNNSFSRKKTTLNIVGLANGNIANPQSALNRSSNDLMKPAWVSVSSKSRERKASRASREESKESKDSRESNQWEKYFRPALNGWKNQLIKWDKFDDSWIEPIDFRIVQNNLLNSRKQIGEGSVGLFQVAKVKKSRKLNNDLRDSKSFNFNNTSVSKFFRQDRSMISNISADEMSIEENQINEWNITQKSIARQPTSRSNFSILKMLDTQKGHVEISNGKNGAYINKNSQKSLDRSKNRIYRRSRTQKNTIKISDMFTENAKRGDHHQKQDMSNSHEYVYNESDPKIANQSFNESEVLNEENKRSRADIVWYNNDQNSRQNIVPKDKNQFTRPQIVKLSRDSYHDNELLSKSVLVDKLGTSKENRYFIRRNENTNCKLNENEEYDNNQIFQNRKKNTLINTQIIGVRKQEEDKENDLNLTNISDLVNTNYNDKTKKNRPPTQNSQSNKNLVFGSIQIKETHVKKNDAFSNERNYQEKEKNHSRPSNDCKYNNSEEVLHLQKSKSHAGNTKSGKIRIKKREHDDNREYWKQSRSKDFSTSENLVIDDRLPVDQNKPSLTAKRDAMKEKKQKEADGSIKCSIQERNSKSCFNVPKGDNSPINKGASPWKYNNLSKRSISSFQIQQSSFDNSNMKECKVEKEKSKNGLNPINVVSPEKIQFPDDTLKYTDSMVTKLVTNPRDLDNYYRDYHKNNSNNIKNKESSKILREESIEERQQDFRKNKVEKDIDKSKEGEGRRIFISINNTNNANNVNSINWRVTGGRPVSPSESMRIKGKYEKVEKIEKKLTKLEKSLKSEKSMKLENGHEDQQYYHQDSCDRGPAYRWAIRSDDQVKNNIEMPIITNSGIELPQKPFYNLEDFIDYDKQISSSRIEREPREYDLNDFLESTLNENDGHFRSINQRSSLKNDYKLTPAITTERSVIFNSVLNLNKKSERDPEVTKNALKNELPSNKEYCQKISPRKNDRSDFDNSYQNNNQDSWGYSSNKKKTISDHQKSLQNIHNPYRKGSSGNLNNNALPNNNIHWASTVANVKKKEETKQNDVKLNHNESQSHFDNKKYQNSRHELKNIRNHKENSVNENEKDIANEYEKGIVSTGENIKNQPGSSDEKIVKIKKEDKYCHDDEVIDSQSNNRVIFEKLFHHKANLKIKDQTIQELRKLREIDEANKLVLLEISRKLEKKFGLWRKPKKDETSKEKSTLMSNNERLIWKNWKTDGAIIKANLENAEKYEKNVRTIDNTEYWVSGISGYHNQYCYYCTRQNIENENVKYIRADENHQHQSNRSLSENSNINLDEQNEEYPSNSESSLFSECNREDLVSESYFKSKYFALVQRNKTQAAMKIIKIFGKKSKFYFKRLKNTKRM